MKSGKTKPFRPHGTNVVTEHYRMDADDDDEDDHDLREAIRNSLTEISGASSEEQTCVISSLTAASSTDPAGSQHQVMDEATAATGTTTSTSGRWRRAQAKRVREEPERPEKAEWKKVLEAKIAKMAEESVRKKMQEIRRQQRPAPPPIPTIKPQENIKENVNPKKKAKLRIHGEDDNSTFSPSDSDENPWANLPLPEWRPPPAAPPRFTPPLPKEEYVPPPPPPPTKAPPMVKMPPPVKVPPPTKAPPMTKAPPTPVNVVMNDFVPPPPAPRRIEPPPSSVPNTYPNNEGYVTPDSGTETDDDRPPPPPTTPYPKSGRNPPGPPPRDEWIQQRVWDAWEERYEIKWVKVRFVGINKEPEIPPLPPALQKQVDEYLEKERKEKEANLNIKMEEKTYIKKEYVDSPYKKPSIPTELIEGHEDGDDHFHNASDWETTFVKTKEEYQKDNWLYPQSAKQDADIFNDESDFDDARSVETDFEDVADDSEYDPAEDEHDQDDEESEEEITWAGENEDIPAQDYVVVIPQEHGADDHHHADDHHDDEDHQHEPYQHQDDVKKLMPVVTARLTTNNNSHKSNQLVPVDYDDIGLQKRLIKDKVYNLGSKQLDFGKYKKFELWWVVKHDPVTSIG